MDLSFTPVPMQYLRQVLRRQQCREETMDAIVPDASPDLERIVGVSASAVVRSKECCSGCVTVTGGIRCSVLYMAEGERLPRSLEVYLPFSEKSDSPDLTEDAHVTADAWIRGADARMVHSRKLAVRVQLCTLTEAYEEVREELCCLTQKPETLQTLETEYPIVLPSEHAERSIQLTEEIRLPANRPLSGQILSYTPRVEITEKRLAGNKAVFKGLVHFSMVYITAEDKLTGFDTEIPFSQYCELKDLYEEEPPTVSVTFTGCELDRTARQDGDGLLLTVHLLAQCVAYRRSFVRFCEDAYSLEGTLEPQWNTWKFRSCLDRQQLSRTLRDSWDGSVSDVVAAQVWPDIPFSQPTDHGAELVVPVSVQVLYYDGAGQLQTAHISTELREGITQSPEVRNQLTACVTGDPAVLSSVNGLELRCSIVLSSLSVAESEFRSLTGGTIREEESKKSDPAVIVRRVRPGESLWQIAKENGTTMDSIRQANHPDTEITENMIILIPSHRERGTKSWK